MPERDRPLTPQEAEALRNTRVRLSINRALKDRGMTHEDVADVLHLKKSTVDKAISSGNFSRPKAERWSTALNIPMEVFLFGTEPLPPNDYELIMEEIADMRGQIEDLREDVNTLLRRTADLS